ncbi:MAG: excalibur domain-containing protein [Hamadaea sp.]|nr:excalibur domain-containing protein [Hamadaea sp.]
MLVSPSAAQPPSPRTTTAKPPSPKPSPKPSKTTSKPKPVCDPNYADGCVPVASDVDCAGGSGNGPAYFSGTARVVGSDIYDLDRDNDGIACEKD